MSEEMDCTKEILIHNQAIDKYKCKKCGFISEGISLKIWSRASGTDSDIDICGACWAKFLIEGGVGQVEKVGSGE